jgi:hypothetical protein
MIGSQICTFTALRNEVEKRNYSNIVGLRAKVTEKDYWYFLEVLPPIIFKDGFFLMEPLTHDDQGAVHYYFFKEKNKYYCEVQHINKSVSNKALIENGFI